jgi:hypothetical protein
MASFAEEKKVPATQAYTKGEIEHVQRVHELQYMCGYPSYKMEM